MSDAEDRELADELQREIDRRSATLTAEEQDWVNTARLAVGPLRSGTASDDERRAARDALQHTPPAAR